MDVAVLKSRSGNVRSLAFALERIGVRPKIVTTAAELKTAERVILPGVGAARSAMAYLAAQGLDQVVKELRVPVLGICLGMQILCARSMEGNTECMGVFKQEVTRFRGPGKIPHMGWNRVSGMTGPLFEGVRENSWFYFVHSYVTPVSTFTVARCRYMGTFSAALQRENFFAVQFHPEKSGSAGRRVLVNFCRIEDVRHE